ncbi:MAG: oligosaccharide flippase family protein [Pseudonocardiaceae bacterium]
MGSQHVRGSTLLLAGRALSLLLNMATQVVVVRALSKTEFGAFAYALALTASGRAVLSLGQAKLLSRFMAKYEEERDYGRMFGAMVLAAATIVVTSSALIVGLFLFADRLAGGAVDDPRAIHVLLVLIFLAPMEALDEVFVSIFAVFSRPQSIFFRKHLLTPVLRLAVVAAVFAVGGGALALAVGYVATGALGLVVYGLLFGKTLRQRGLRGHFRPGGLVLPYKSVFLFSFPTLTSELVSLSMHTASVMVLGFHRGMAQVAGYRAVLPAARLNSLVFSTFSLLFLPMASRLFARGEHDELREAYWHAAFFLAVFTFPIFALTGPFATQTTVTLFGARYADSALILTVLAVGYYVNAALGFNAYTLQVFGRLRAVVAINVAVALVNLVLCLVLVPHWGALGVAFANGSAFVLLNLLNQAALARCTRSGLVDRHYARGYAVIAGGVIALWLVQQTFHPGIVVAVTVTALVWGAVLLLTQRWLRLEKSFPELARIPLVRKVLGQR